MKVLSTAITLILLSTFSLTSAQSGKVYLTTGDTLSGKIDILLPSKYFEEVTIKVDRKKRRVKSFQMLGFKSNDKTYKVIKFGSKYRIMEEVVSGYLGLYRFRPENSFDFSSRFLYKATNEGIEVPNITFKKSVAEFVAECPEVQTAVKNRVYKGSNIEDMIDAFNNCLNEMPKYVAVESKGKKSKKKEEKVSKELKLIQIISAKLKSENIDDELTTLLKDLENKISKGEKVPSYLTGALKESAGNYDTVNKEVSSLLELLK